MSNCRDIQGALAAALYEPLDEAEQRMLDAHLASCPACQAEFAGLQAMMAALPADNIEYSGDLLPAVREALRRRPAAGSVGVRRWVFTAFAMVCIGFVFYMVGMSQPDSPESIATTSESATDRVLTQAANLVAQNAADDALALLQTALSSAESPTDEGKLLLAVANLQFDVFHRYADAYAGYKAVRESYGLVFSQSEPWVKDRHDLLEQASVRDYWALYEMDKARGMGDLGIPRLEQVMASYPGQIVSREALGVMVAEAGGQGIEALEHVKEQCSNPIALAQIDVHLGERYYTDKVDPALGRQMLNDVAKNENVEVAQMAKAVLATLEHSAQQ